MGSIGSGFQLGGSGASLFAGNFGQTLVEGAKSVFGNEQVAQGFRSILSGLRGGTPINNLDPGYIPGVAENAPFNLGMRPDWDANAWRPNGVAMRAGQPGAWGSANGMGPANGMDPGMLDDGLPYDRMEGGGSLLKQGLGEIASGMATAARNSAIFSGVISLAINGYKVIKGHTRPADAAGSVVADTAGGAVAGATGALASGLALAAAGAFGLTVGLPLTLLGVAAGLGGALAGNWIFKRTGLYDGIRTGVSRLFGGTSLGGTERWQAPWPSPGGSGYSMPGYSQPGGSVGGMVPVNPNLGRPIPMH